MKAIIFTLLSVALFCSIHKDENGIVILKEETLPKAIIQYEYLLVQYYTQWCTRCKKFQNEYNQISHAFSSKVNVGIAKIDMTELKESASTQYIKKYPTLKLFFHNTSQEYQGEKKKDNIIVWIKKKMSFLIRCINSDELDIFLNQNEIAIVYFGTNRSDINLLKKLSQAETILFALASFDEGYIKHKVKEGTLVLFRHYGEGKRVFSGKFTDITIADFIKENAYPLVMKLNLNNAVFLLDQKKPGLILYRDENSENTPHHDDIMRKLSKKIYDKIQVYTSDVIQENEKKISDYLGIKVNNLPMICLNYLKKKYQYTGEITEENVMEWVKKWESGELKATLKSQKIPQEQTKAVYVLVGETFRDIVIKGDKDVLVKFYAPWCKHCIQLAPIYEKLAIMLNHNKNLLIAEVDMTENDLEEVNIEMYPTIMMWPAGKKKSPIEFKGARTIEDLIKFIQETATYAKTLSKSDL